MPNKITQLFNIKHPIIQAGMIWNSGWKLASAASNSGILGLIGAGSMYPQVLREHIQKCKKATNKPFGINVPMLYPNVQEIMDIIVEEDVKIVFTSAGNPKTWTKWLQEKGITVVHVVSSVKFALKAQESGVDAVVAEGFEAGGHNGRDETTTLTLIPMVKEQIQIPLIAAGGIATGKAMLAAMVLGADAVQVGSRFVASEESSAHQDFKQVVVDAKEGDTQLTLKELAPVRLIKNKFFSEVQELYKTSPTPEQLKELLGRARAKRGMFEGDLEDGELEIGQIAGLIHDIKPVAQIVEDMTKSCGALPPSLKAYYRFNQGVAGGNNAGVTTLNDETGVNNGTLTSFSLSGALSNWVAGKYTPNSITTNSLSICQGDSALIFGVYQNTSGSYQDTLLAANGCGDSLIVTNLIITPTVNTVLNTIICQGDSVLIGGLYQSVAGNYVDSLQASNGCDSLFTTVLILNSLPSVSIAAFVPNTIWVGSSPVSLPAGTPILGTYSGNGVSGGNFDPAISGLGSHFVTYTFTDGNGCVNSDSTDMLVVAGVGLNENNTSSNIKIFPNPTKDVLTIQVSEKRDKDLEINLVNVTGKTVKSITIPENTQKIKLRIADLNKGIYYLIIPENNHKGIYKVTKF